MSFQSLSSPSRPEPESPASSSSTATLPATPTRRRKSMASLAEVFREAHLAATSYMEESKPKARVLSARTITVEDAVELGPTTPTSKKRRSVSVSLVFEKPRPDAEALYLELRSPVTTPKASPDRPTPGPFPKRSLFAQLWGLLGRFNKTLKWIFARRKLYSYEELPSWLKAANRNYIRRGYQANLSGYREAWAMAVSQFTNETVNIWSHLLGGAVFVALGVQCFGKLHPAATVYDRLIFGAYCALATKSMLSSALFHTHFHLSPKAYRLWCSVDTTGISFLTLGSGSLLAYYIFHENKRVQVAWLTVVSLVNIVGMAGPTFSFWTAPHLRKMRVLVYSASGLLSVLPAMYIMAVGLPPNWPKSATSWILGSFASYSLGTIIYLGHIPERWFPGLFDYLFASHQLWHGLVIAGAYTMFRAGYDLMKWRLGLSPA